MVLRQRWLLLTCLVVTILGRAGDAVDYVPPVRPEASAKKLTEGDTRDHWAFRAPQRPLIPTVTNATWPRNPVDSFVLAKLESRRLAPQRRADPRLLLRRVYLDLVGLPPTLEEQEAFLADPSPNAYEEVVDRLLDSQQYGERWGRHFMDLWRYSDWWGLGAEVRNSQKHIWHWRDWIIESLNSDKGYDQMILEMLAADELYPNDLDRLRATGYLARQYFKFNRTSWLDETLEHTSKAFLGLTLNCGKCHDHKYDPFSQVEYYRLRAFFEPYQIRTDMVPGESNFDKDGIPRAFDCNLDASTYLHIRGDDRNPDKGRIVEASLPAFLSFDDFRIEPVVLPVQAHQTGLREFVVENLVRSAEQVTAEAREALAKATQELARAEQLEPDRSVASASASTQPTDPEAIKPLVQDDFKSVRADLWDPLTGKWQYVGDKLVQLEDGPTRCTLRLKKPVPENFEAKLRFTTSGGQTWKSVGIAFDVAGETNELLAYLSAYASGPKLQIAYKQGSTDYQYPPEGATARDVKLATPYELYVRVRGAVVNVSIDGKHALAYRLPVPRRTGSLDVITFDARAEFDHFEMAELATGVSLVEPANSAAPPPATSVEVARGALVFAEKQVTATEAEVVSVRARAAADHARSMQPEPENVRDLVCEAARAEKTVAVARAEADLARAELEFLKAPESKKQELATKRDASRTALENAKKALENPGEAHTPLRGSLKTPESNLETEESRSKPFPTTSTGRRSALARWIASPRNPLTARVLANHVWSRHFGRPLVSTVFDFGRKGAPPTNPELLDWLAVEFMESGWSLKHLHRLIVTSSTYRMSSSNLRSELPAEPRARPESPTDPDISADTENQWFWRANPVRMEAQIIRDSLLWLAGDLDLRVGGPSVQVNDENSRRRSLYFAHSNNDQHRFLSMFDDAKIQECYRRAESVVPQQALALENSRLTHEAAGKIARRIVDRLTEGSDEAFVRTAFLVILADEPSPDEINACKQGMVRLRDAMQHAGVPEIESRVKSAIVQSLLNHNDFVTIR